MKKCAFLCVDLFLLMCNAYSITRFVVIDYTPDSYIIEETNKNDSILDTFYATIVSNDLLHEDELSIEFQNGSIFRYTKYYSETFTEKDFTVAYKNGCDEMAITRYHDFLIGHVGIQGKMFAIKQLSNDICMFQELYLFDENDDFDDNFDAYSIEDLNADELSRSSSDTSIIRILVLYSNRTIQRYNILELGAKIQQAIFDANLSFVNSQINVRLELVYWGATEYSADTARIVVLQHFQNDNDGYMDEVHLLRQTYSADVCILLDEPILVCGRAADIKASSDAAFAIVKPSCGCCGKFSLAHEIGHLIGCRHNKTADDKIVPYRYGHGYVYLGNENHWRTMMSYSNECISESDCPRIPYWSNPDVEYLGASTGNSIYCNNARVWRQRASTVASFFSEPENMYLMEVDVMNANYGLCRANNRITSLGPVVVQASTELILSAPTVYLEEGFHALPGSNLRITTENDNLCSFVQRCQYSNVPTAFSNSDDHKSQSDLETKKIVRDGQVLIIMANGVYNTLGIKVADFKN